MFLLLYRAIVFVLIVPWLLSAQQKNTDFFEVQVRPVLNVCWQCHNSRLATSGLALDSREGLLRGGNRGAAVNLGQPMESLIIQSVRQSGDLKMPPAGRLSPEQVDVLVRWIQMGLPWDAKAEAPESKSRRGDYWAFQRPKHGNPPPVKKTSWVRNSIDKFVLSVLESKKVEPSPEADRYTLLRRVSLDLVGLPPSPKEIETFLSDTSGDAYEKVVDRLLASRHYGERWGRHWLDLARYADSNGYNIDQPRPIWKYRDWVIQALNKDQSFDQFVVDQIAGDLVPNPTIDQLIATGFHRNTPGNFEGGIDFEQYRVEAVADRVATTGAVFLGLTVGCARCHDHKYDPITQREFYQLFAFFNNTDEINKEPERAFFFRPVLELPTPEEAAASEAYWAQVTVLSRELLEYGKALMAKPRQPVDPPLHNDLGLLARVNALREFMQPPPLPDGVPAASEYRWRKPEVTRTLITRELPEPRETYIHLGGDFLRRGMRVYPGVPAALSSKPVTGNRLDFAKWLVDPENPLTARVTVNRMWQALFEKGLVETENDFGATGATPTHPALLDWLATEFISRGWSQKSMLKLMVMSATYRQSSRHRPELEETDPYNRLLARQSRPRLEAEIIRDSALVASGLLTPTIGGPSVFPPIPDGAMAVTQIRRPWPTETGPARYRRGLYTFFFRMSPAPSLVLFDAPNASETCTRRVRSNSPLQALTLLNDQAFMEFAVALAKRTLDEAPAQDQGRLKHAFLLALQRSPEPNEIDRLASFLAQQRTRYATDPASAIKLLSNYSPPTGRPQRGTAEGSTVSHQDAPELAAWISVSRVLLNLDAFMTRE